MHIYLWTTLGIAALCNRDLWYFHRDISICIYTNGLFEDRVFCKRAMRWTFLGANLIF